MNQYTKRVAFILNEVDDETWPRIACWFFDDLVEEFEEGLSEREIIDIRDAFYIWGWGRV